MEDSYGRPTTARPGTSAGIVFNRPPQFTAYSDSNQTYEEDDESEDGDVFAYLPPSTAEQEQEQEQERQHELHLQRPETVYSQAPPVSQFKVTVPSLPYQDVPYPSPSHNPYARFPSDTHHSPLPGPSNIQSQLLAHHDPMTPSASTESYMNEQEGYRMSRMNTRSTNQSGKSSHQVSLGFSLDKPYAPSDLVHRPSAKRRVSSKADSEIMTASMIDDESRVGSIKMDFDFDAIEEEDSPYPEVRASVSNVDDPEMPALTLRMWVIGLTLCCISSAFNVFFNFRQPAPTVVPLALLLISYPIGKFAAYTLPIRVYRLPHWLGGLELSLNPGPWNIKEHVLVYIMANVATTSPYALNTIVVADIYYDIPLDFGYSICLVLATQLTGFGLAGLCRRFLVWPASMVWPQNLVTCTLLNTLHAEEDEGQGGITRYRYFSYVMLGAFFWYFLPGFLFTGLSVFSWVCWLAPNKVALNQMFGVQTGMGMSVITFDWNQISWVASPLVIPWWAEVHIITGFILFYWILTPALYYSNVWELAHFPMSSDIPYDRHGLPYNVSLILTSDDRFNLTGYNAYSPLYLPATYAMTYLLAFTLSTGIIVHTVLYHGSRLINGFKKMRMEPDDIHAKLMKHYPEVPDWWYISVFVAFFVLMIIAQEVWHTGVPIWALLLSLILPIVYVLPSGFIYAMTGQGVQLNLLAQIIPGTVLPGNPLANMVFKAYSVQTMTEATSFAKDLKLGHYIKVPPRATFLVQAVATTMAAFVQVGTKTWLFNAVPDICQPKQKDFLTCPHNQVYYTASAVWGLVGPTRQFGVNSTYNIQLYAMIIGVFLPLPFWLWQRRYPNSWVKYVNVAVVINGVAAIPPATGINFSSFFAVAVVFQYWLRKHRFAWWSKFNYITSAALDSGTVISLIVIFLTLQLPRHGSVSVKWWGNEVWQHTADYNGTPYLSIPPNGLPWNNM